MNIEEFESHIIPLYHSTIFLSSALDVSKFDIVKLKCYSSTAITLTVLFYHDANNLIGRVAGCYKINQSFISLSHDIMNEKFMRIKLNKNNDDYNDKLIIKLKGYRDKNLNDKLNDINKFNNIEQVKELKQIEPVELVEPVEQVRNRSPFLKRLNNKLRTTNNKVNNTPKFREYYGRNQILISSFNNQIGGIEAPGQCEGIQILTYNNDKIQWMEFKNIDS